MRIGREQHTELALGVSEQSGLLRLERGDLIALQRKVGVHGVEAMQKVLLPKPRAL